MVCTGALVSSLLGLSLDWRWISGISAVHPVILFLVMFLIPESPFFLVKQGNFVILKSTWKKWENNANSNHSTGRREEAIRSLKWLRGPSVNLENELTWISCRVETDAYQTRFGDFIQPSIFRPVLIAVGLMVMSQLSGVNAALFYAYDIFNSSTSSLDSLVSTAVLYSILVIKYFYF